jgi:putative transposase
MRLVRYTYRVRVSATAERALLAEWDRCRWVWNQSVAESRQAWKDKWECGPAGLDKMLTGWRAEHAWLREGSSVAQKQAIRDFGKSRAKALKDRKDKIPVRQRAGLPQFKKRDRSRPTMNYTKQGFSLRGGRLVVAGGSRCAWFGRGSFRPPQVLSVSTGTRSGTGMRRSSSRRKPSRCRKPGMRSASTGA